MYSKIRSVHHKNTYIYRGGKQPMVNDRTFAVLDEATLYWIGWLYANLFICYVRGKASASVYANSKQIYMLEKFLQFAEFRGSVFQQNPNLFVIRSIPLAGIAMELGIIHAYAKRVALPAYQDSIPFWRGYVDGNGSAGSNDTTWYLDVQGPKGLLEQLHDFALRHGVDKQYILPIIHTKRYDTRDNYETSFVDKGADILYSVLVSTDTTLFAKHLNEQVKVARETIAQRKALQKTR